MISQTGQYSNPRHELWTLLEGLCEDRLSPAEFGRLEHLILTDPAARRIYRDYMDLHGSLYWDTALAGQPPLALPMATPAKPSQSKAVVRRIQKRFGLLTLAFVLMIGLGIWLASALQTESNPANLANNGEDSQPVPPENRPVPNGGETDKSDTPRKLEVVKNDPWPAIAQRSSVPRNAVPKLPEVPNIVVNNANDVPADHQPKLGSVDAIVSAINREIRAGWEAAEVSPSPIAKDAEWLRRVHLDLVGQIPSSEAVDEFLNDRRENKRALVVNELLSDPAYVRHFATVWTNLLVGRSTEREVDRFAVHRFLRESIGRNHPWSQVVYELVAAEGPAEENGASGFLLAHLNNEAVPATAITARLFLCQQVQCTQCHKHPYNEADQSQFWELNSFFKQTAIERRRVREPGGESRQTAVLVSKSEGGPTFYEDLRGVVQPAYPKFSGVEVSPEPHINRRRELAQLMTQGEDPQIAKAMVNRMWSHFFGYGFTRPVDDMGPHNPPSHPELLDQLAKEFVQSGYDVKQLICWICLSDPYQRSSQFTATNQRDNPSAGEPALFSRAYVRSMTAEQLYDSLLVASKAHFASGSSWEEIQHQRQLWLQQFVTAFETEENDEDTQFEGTVPQALLLMNSELVEQAVLPKQGTYFSEVLNSPINETEKIRRLCLAALSRYPSSQELAAARKLLQTRRAAANNPRASVEGMQDIFWAYLNSNEFILVH